MGAQDSTFHETEAATQDWNCTSGAVIQPAHALEDHDLELPSDSLAALLLLRAQFPRTEVVPRHRFLPTEGGKNPRELLNVKFVASSSVP